MAPFTAQQKLNEIKREIAMRVRVYPGLIASGRMTLAEAERRTDIMRAIAIDYEKQVEEDQQRLL